MQRDRLTAAGLILGCAGFIVTMAIHPTGGGYEKIIRQAPVTIAAHALAIASLGVMAAAFARFTRAARNAGADAGMAAFAIAAIGGGLAATVSGLLGPMLAERAIDADPSEASAWRVVFGYNFRLNAALTQVFIVGAAAAVLLCSAGLVRLRGGWRAVGVAGVVIGGAGLIAQLGGFIRHSLHDLTLFVLGFSLWTIALAILIWRAAAPHSRTDAERDGPTSAERHA